MTFEPDDRSAQRYTSDAVGRVAVDVSNLGEVTAKVSVAGFSCEPGALKISAGEPEARCAIVTRPTIWLLRIRVSDSDHHPVPNVAVTAFTAAPTTVSTDSDGLVVLPIAWEQPNAEFSVVARGYAAMQAAAARPPETGSGPYAARPLRIVLAKATELEIFVVAPDGQGIPGADLSLSTAPGVTWTTGDSGEATVDALPESWTHTYCTVTAENMISVVDEIVRAEIGPSGSHRIALERGVELQGIVRSISGAPIAGARATWYATDGSSAVRGRSNEGGELDMVVPAGPGQLLVRAAGFVEKTRSFDLDARKIPFHIDLAPGLRVHGKVRDARSKKPIALAQVTPMLRGQVQTGTGRTKADGEFVLDELAVEPDQIRIRYPGYREHFEEIRSSRTVVELQPTDAFSGTVVSSSGERIEHVRVRTVHPHAIERSRVTPVDSDGRWHATIDGASDSWLGIGAAGYGEEFVPGSPSSGIGPSVTLRPQGELRWNHGTGNAGTLLIARRLSAGESLAVPRTTILESSNYTQIGGLSSGDYSVTWTPKTGQGWERPLVVRSGRRFELR